MDLLCEHTDQVIFPLCKFIALLKTTSGVKSIESTAGGEPVD